MTIDNRLSFDNHVSVICKKINNQFNVMLRFRKLINKETLLKLYKAFILPHFYYCSSVWHFCGARNADKVDNLNKRILRFILQDYSSPLACSAGVFFERAICSRKRHVETSRREEEMGRVKGSGEGAGRESIFFSPPPPPFPSFALAPTVRVTISTLPYLPLSTNTNKVSPTQNTPALQASSPYDILLSKVNMKSPFIRRLQNFLICYIRVCSLRIIQFI